MTRIDLDFMSKFKLRLIKIYNPDFILNSKSKICSNLEPKTNTNLNSKTTINLESNICINF